MSDRIGPDEPCFGPLHLGPVYRTFIGQFNLSGRDAVCCAQCSRFIRWATDAEEAEGRRLDEALK